MTLQFPIISFDYFQLSPAKRFLALTRHPGFLDSELIDNIFRDLKPIHPDRLIGEWDGFVLSTSHPFQKELEELNWLGNTFDSTEDVAPLIVAKNGNRVRFDDWGSALLREMKYQGVVSAALVYDERPVIVHYRAVRSNLVAGVMESKSFGSAGKFFFYLTR
ncbi:hypothetical protein N7532_005629 [Penicillium argentinense]|uniref:DUF4334 domain-containing protein n=1 Tax=Penicillium argentinense TaxID=1131581 RepID=A0A9W9FE81_9EURO|nr:uncharacterized protein N7532_005629 [Penicillium argentinense]KAJ5098628.1 hypothetical protein N7532_005629 [Penicillium argentinense]